MWCFRFRLSIVDEEWLWAATGICSRGGGGGVGPNRFYYVLTASSADNKKRIQRSVNDDVSMMDGGNGLTIISGYLKNYPLKMGTMIIVNKVGWRPWVA